MHSFRVKEVKSKTLESRFQFVQNSPRSFRLTAPLLPKENLIIGAIVSVDDPRIPIM